MDGEGARRFLTLREKIKGSNPKRITTNYGATGGLRYLDPAIMSRLLFL
jgi:hypothetical protein